MSAPPLDCSLTRRRFLAAAAIVGTACAARIEGADARGETGIAPFRIEGDRLVIPAATYAVPGKSVVIRATASLRIDPVDVVTVRGEELLLSDKKPSGFFVGTQLKGTKAKNIGAFRSLIEDSVVLRDAAGRELVKGDDYLVAAPFALLGIGTKPSVTPTTKVYATYSHYAQRIDAVVVDAMGGARLVRGTPHLVTPTPPPAPDGATVLAHVYRPFRATALEAAHVFPITARAADAVTVTNAGRVPKTLRKLQRGEPVTIVCWGDSITVGADVNPEEAWANLLLTELTRTFPRAAITHRNHSIGGTKTAQWLHNGDYPGLPKQNTEKCRFDNVLNEKPDLVVMEFLNDIVFPEDVLRKTYDAIDAAFRARGIEWIIVTPSQKIPESFALAEMKDGQPRLLDRFLREFAATRGYALADAAARWKHLHHEGIPYFALFNNGYNHPNAFGHRIFVEEILKCFRA